MKHYLWDFFFTWTWTSSQTIIVCSHFMGMNTDFKFLWFKKYLVFYTCIQFKFIIITMTNAHPISLTAKTIMSHKFEWRGCYNVEIWHGGTGCCGTQWDITCTRWRSLETAWRKLHSMVKFKEWYELGVWVNVEGNSFCGGVRV